jgi:hypothetical protein
MYNVTFVSLNIFSSHKVEELAINFVFGLFPESAIRYARTAQPTLYKMQIFSKTNALILTKIFMDMYGVKIKS